MSLKNMHIINIFLNSLPVENLFILFNILFHVEINQKIVFSISLSQQYLIYCLDYQSTFNNLIYIFPYFCYIFYFTHYYI